MYDHQSHKTKAIIFMIISATLFSVMSALVKLSGDLPSMEKALFRNIVALGISYILLKKNNIPVWGAKENRRMLILRSVVGSLGLISYFYSIDKLILADSSMLNKLSPFFVVLFAWMFLKTKINHVKASQKNQSTAGTALQIQTMTHFIK